MDDEPGVIRLRDRVPDLGTEHYDKAVRLHDATIYRFVSTKGEQPIADALAEGIPLAALAAAVTKRQRLKKCTHRKHNTLDPDTRQLTCDDCGVAWDPLDLLLEIAAGDVRTYRSLVDRKNLGAEIKALTAQRDDMARLAKNEKAKLARAKKSQDKIERLNDVERFELERYRERDDIAHAARSAKGHQNAAHDRWRKITEILTKLATARRGAKKQAPGT